jgi:hypothetical protein
MSDDLYESAIQTRRTNWLKCRNGGYSVTFDVEIALNSPMMGSNLDAITKELREKKHRYSGSQSGLNLNMSYF